MKKEWMSFSEKLPGLEDKILIMRSPKSLIQDYKIGKFMTGRAPGLDYKKLFIYYLLSETGSEYVITSNDKWTSL